MSKYGKTYTESGILRKNDVPDKIEDLLVFGYACKLFRDDEKALEIDQGKHLIPWMGDETLKIDRYDGRAALSDLSLYENTSEGYDTARWLGLTDSERHVEHLCDEERYRALNTNEDEEEMYREEELKRLHQQLSNAQNYGQVSYSYESGESEDKQEGNKSIEATAEKDDEPFVPPPDLDLPINMKVPETVKQHARIEKTAMFISKQGAQMEILLKAKQAGNPQFDFLSQDSSLYPYYRHILMAMKTGHYRIQQNDQKNEVQEREEEDDHYLHPSLAAASAPRVESAPSIPNITYKPSADCAYTMLISKIKGTKPQELQSSEPVVKEQPPPPVTEFAETRPTFSPNNTYVYDYNTGKYEPNSETSAAYTSSENIGVEQTVTVDSHVQYSSAAMVTPSTLMQAYGLDAATAAQYAAYMQSYGAYYGSGGAMQTGEIAKGAVLYGKDNLRKSSETILNPEKHYNDTSQYNVQTYQKYDPEISQVQLEKEKPKPLLPIAHYSSGSESDSEIEDENATKAIINVLAYEIPPADIQLIVDKMASYVARNGRDFENIVKAKGDQRFSFLDKGHMFHAYYKHKLKTYGAVFEEEHEEEIDVKNNVVTESESTVKSDSEENISENKNAAKEKRNTNKEKVIAPVSFSIKKSKENEPVTIERSALPVEESSDEEGKDDNTVEEETEVRTKTNSDNQVKIDRLLEIDKQAEEPTNLTTINEIKIEADKTEEEPQKELNPQVIEIDDTIEEFIDLTDDTEEKRDARRAEDKIKDKLAAAAREKLSSISRDRALQLERKRRAAAFLSKIKPHKISKCSTNGTNNPEDMNPPKMAEEDDFLKRMCETEDGEITSDSPELNIASKETERKRSRSRSGSERRHRNRKKKKKFSRSSSPEAASRKHGKKSRHSKDRKKSKKHRSRSRSRSRRSQSRSRHSRSTSVMSGY